MPTATLKCVFCKSRQPAETMLKFPVGSVCNEKCKLGLISKGYAKNRLAAAKQVSSAIKRKHKDVKKKHAKQKKEYYDKHRPTRLKAAIKAFNAYIRKRDENKPCISCEPGTGEVIKITLKGGAYDCGHFLTVGAFPELRFTEVNAYRQCKKCNGGSGKYTKKNHTVAKQYRINLIERIGLDKVQWLEGPHDQVKLTAMDLKDIELKYKKKLKELICIS